MDHYRDSYGNTYQADVKYEHIYKNGNTFVASTDGSLQLGPDWEELKNRHKDRRFHMKKIYTKYDYIYIYSKLGVITTTFAVVSISLSLFLGFIVTLAGHAHPDLSSRICFVLFVLNLPFVLRKVKHYQAIRNKLQKRHPDDSEG